MKLKPTLRNVLLAVLVAAGYGSAAVSLPNCQAACAAWLPTQAPPGSTQNYHHAEPANLFLPFVATVSFESKCLLAPAANEKRQLEQGTQYYLTVFPFILPLWTASKTITVVA